MTDQDFAILRDGDLVCKECGDQRPDHILKWFSIAKLPDDVLAVPEGTKEKFKTHVEKVMEEIEALEEPESFECPHCEFTAKSKAGLSSHVYHKHGKGEG